MESEWVCDQTRTYLIEPLRHYYRAQQTVAFVGGNSFVYYPPDARFLGPDFYVVRGGRQGAQSKWVSWEEGGLLPSTVYVEGFHLQKGHYVALRPEADGWFWVRSLGLFLGVSDGWVRLRTQQGVILETGRELACAERAKADAERLRAEAAENELLALREELRRLQS